MTSRWACNAGAGGFALRALQREQFGIEHDQRVAGVDTVAEPGPDLADAAGDGRGDIDFGGLKGARGIGLFAVASAAGEDEGGEGEEGDACGSVHVRSSGKFEMRNSK